MIAADAYGGDATDRRARCRDRRDPLGLRRGTRHRIGAATDGLLACGEPGVQLTWMDAKLGDDCITPRIGKPVEIQALWLNALAIAGRRDRALARHVRARPRRVLSRGSGIPGAAISPTSSTAITSPVRRRVAAPEPAVRDRRLAAAADRWRRRARGRRHVERELWTPAGPRTLAEHDPSYRGRYVGGVDARDRAYHQGTVWPWLAGAFVDAWVRVRGDRGRGASRAVRHAAAGAYEHRRARTSLRDLRRRSAASPGRLSVSGVVGRGVAQDRATRIWLIRKTSPHRASLPPDRCRPRGNGILLVQPGRASGRIHTVERVRALIRSFLADREPLNGTVRGATA